MVQMLHPAFHEKHTTAFMVGKYGEEIAAQYLEERSFVILERNYKKKMCEVDIVSRDTCGVIRFIEVKSVSHGTKAELVKAVTRETWQPEELVHGFKRMQLKRGVRLWMMEKNYQGAVQIDVAAIHLVMEEKYASVKLLENVVAA